MHLEKFQTRKPSKFKVDCYNILTVGIGIIRFHVNIISGLDFSIILHFLLLYIFLKGEYFNFFTCGFFHKLST